VFSVLRCLCSVLGCFSEFSGVCVGVICFLGGLRFMIGFWLCNFSCLWICCLCELLLFLVVVGFRCFGGWVRFWVLMCTCCVLAVRRWLAVVWVLWCRF